MDRRERVHAPDPRLDHAQVPFGDEVGLVENDLVSEGDLLARLATIRQAQQDVLGVDRPVETQRDSLDVVVVDVVLVMVMMIVIMAVMIVAMIAVLVVHVASLAVRGIEEVGLQLLDPVHTPPPAGLPS